MKTIRIENNVTKGIKGFQEGKPPWNKGIVGLIHRSEETRRKMSEAKKGRTPWIKGKKHSAETIIRFSEQKTGEKNPMWKGDKVKIRALHNWVARRLGKPTTCEHCGRINLLNTKERNIIHWANKSRMYLRDLNDWLRLCVWCHKKYDSKNNNT
mgnify:CR=1 FL=1